MSDQQRPPRRAGAPRPAGFPQPGGASEHDPAQWQNAPQQPYAPYREDSARYAAPRPQPRSQPQSQPPQPRSQPPQLQPQPPQPQPRSQPQPPRPQPRPQPQAQQPQQKDMPQRMGSARYVAPQAQPRTAAHTSPENQDDSRFDKPSRWSRIPAVLPKRSPAMKLATKHASRPTDYVGIAVRIGTITLALLLPLIFMTASAPLSATPLPDVEERFHDWVLTQNSITVRDLPGDTPEPGSLAAQIVSQVESQEDPAAEQAPVQTPAPTAPPAAPEERYPQYASGELVHETDTLSVSIEQYNDGENTYYVADVLIKDPLQFGYAFSYDTFKGARESVSDIADRHQAVIAINSDFAGFHNEGVIIRGFELFRKQNVKAKRHLLIVDQQGDMSALTDRSEKQGVVANRLMNEGVMHTFEFGPLLVENGEAVELPKSFVIRAQDGYYEPRTAIGQIGPLHYILIVVDGRQEGYSKGVSLPRLQELFIEHGAEFAFNLDGGGSTTLYFKGKVINHPSSGDERRVSDIIMFKD